MKILLFFLTLAAASVASLAEKISVDKVPPQFLPTLDEPAYFNLRVVQKPEQLPNGKFVCWVQAQLGNKHLAILSQAASSVKVGDIIHVWFDGWIENEVVRSPNPSGTWYYAFTRRATLYADGTAPDGPVSNKIPIVTYVTP